MTREEAIKILSERYSNALFSERTALETLIPELKESEDEKMIGVIRLALTDVPEERFTTEGTSLSEVLAWLEKQKAAETPQWMIDFLNDILSSCIIYDDYVRRQEYQSKVLGIIKWLENQKEKTPQWIIDFLKEIRPYSINKEEYEGYGGRIEFESKILAIIKWLEGNFIQQKEQKLTNEYQNWELIHEFVEKFGRIPKDEDELNALVDYVLKRQKPVEWSEEDERIRKELIKWINNNKTTYEWTYEWCENKDRWIAWLEKQKDYHKLYEDIDKSGWFRKEYIDKCIDEEFKQKEQKPIKMEVHEVGKGTTICGQDYKCKKDYQEGTCWYIKDVIYHCSRDGYLNDQNGISWSCTPEWFNEYIYTNSEWADEEKKDFIGGQFSNFIQCKTSFDRFKEGEHYWLEYVGDDMYVGRSDNILNQKFHITPRQLYTLFSQQLDVNEDEQKPAEDWREKRKEECPFRRNLDNNLYGCERYADVISECTGACSWVVDYPKLKEIQDKKEQKPTEWSEDDEEMLVKLLDSISIGNNYEEMRNWLLPKLKSLHPQPKQEQKESSDKGEISDGYHTFNELYYYRLLYNAAFFNLLPKEWVHKSKRHHDGEECFGGGWFIVMANLPTGQISNHYEIKDWDLFHIPEKETADRWDGHTPQEAAERLHKFLLEMPDLMPAEYLPKENIDKLTDLMKLKKNIPALPDDMDQQCISLCNTLNSLPGVETFESCCGHCEYRYCVWFFCDNIDTLSRLGRATNRNYSDGRWEVVVDSTDTRPYGVFWLRTKEPFSTEEEMEESTNGLIEDIHHWFKDEFDYYFSKEYKH